MSHKYRQKPSLFAGMKLKYINTVRFNGLEMLGASVVATIDATLGKYDVVHFHALGPSTLSFLPRCLGIKTVVTVHGLDWQRAKWGFAAKAYLKFGDIAAASFPTATIVVSETLRRHYARRGKVTKYIPNGIPVVKPYRIEESNIDALESGRYVLFVGRLTRERNVDQLIRAFTATTNSYKLVIVGDIEEPSPYVRRLVELASLDARVLLVGRLSGSELWAVISNARLFVLPSAIEGLPIALIEALAFGVPALVSDIAENVEVITHDGMLCASTFRVGDESHLRAQLERLLTPASLEMLGAVGKAAVKAKYDWDSIAAETERLYMSITAGEAK
jgi:glycosyltransferase involved in cell wall biosynthesis